LLGSAIDHSVARSRKIDPEQDFRKLIGARAWNGARQAAGLALAALLEADAVFADPVFDFAELVLFDADGFVEALPADLVLFFADDFEVDFLELCTFPPWLRDLRAVRTGRFQPAALSARNVRGIAMTLSGLSTTDATAASARSARTSEITLAGRRARAA